MKVNFSLIAIAITGLFLGLLFVIVGMDVGATGFTVFGSAVLLFTLVSVVGLATQPSRDKRKEEERNRAVRERNANNTEKPKKLSDEYK